MDSVGMRLDKGFYPMCVFVGDFKNKLKEVTPARLEFSLWRENGFVVSTYAEVLPSGVDDTLNFKYSERLIKSVLWTVGGFKLSIRADERLFEQLKQAFAKGGLRDFDVCFFEKVYGVPFTVEYCEDIPQTVCEYILPEENRTGSRIGLDAGGSDIKIAALSNGEVVFSKEIVWQPKINANPDYHIGFINDALREASSKIEKVDSVGVSSAGIFVNNETRVASLFSKVPEKDFEKIRSIYIDAAKRLGAPVTVVNDGDVAALAGAMEYGLNNLLGIAMGTSEAAGFIDDNGRLWGWLNELAFVPVDANENSAVDEWSGDYGTGVKYLSQDGVIKLAQMGGIAFTESSSPAERLKVIQGLVESGDSLAESVFHDIGKYLAYSLMYYRSFYNFDNVLLMGRVVSGRGGEIVLKTADAVLRDFGEDGEACVRLMLPDEKSRRVGQAVAAAGL